MIKVCHMTSAHAPRDTRIFYKECVSLAKAGYEVFLVERGESFDEAGVHVIGVGLPSGSRLSRMTSFSKKIYEAALALDADIYHFHDPELLPYGLKLRRKGKKVIFDSHEHTVEAIMEKKWLPAPLRKLTYWTFRGYQASICRKLSAIITVSPHMVAFFKQYNLNTVQIANFPIFLQDDSAVSPRENRIIFAGGISDQWMHVSILKALEQIPGCRYTLCGPVQDNYLAQLQSLPGWSKTDYLGRIPHEKVAEQMARCAVGLAVLRPGRNSDWKNGTIGNTKIFEEMMAGLPVVCTDFVLWKEFVDRWHCGICVDPENVDEIAGAIRYLLDHPEEARRMGENGRRAVKEEFNWAVEERKLLALYSGL